MTFNNNIPQSADDPSVSQGQLLNNFSTLYNFCLVNHEPLNSANQGKHTFCQFPEQVSDPTTASAEGAIYCAQNPNSSKTDAYFRTESNGNVYQLSCTKAWVTFNGVSAVIGSSMNVASVTKNSTGNYTITFTNALPTASYLILITCGENSGFPNSIAGGTITNQNTASFSIKTKFGGGLFDANPINIMVIQ